MAVTALIKFTQGGNTDVPGRAVLGDMTSGPVTVTNGDNTNVVSWEYELLYVPPGSAEPLATQGPNATPSFSFGQPDVEGSYRVRLTVRDIDGNKDIDIRNLVVPFPNRGLIAPPYQGNPLPLPVVTPAATTPAPKPDEMNIAGQAFGWSGDEDTGRKLLYQLIKELDAITGSSGAAGGDLGGTYPNPNVNKGNFGGTHLDLSTVADGDLLKRVGTLIQGYTLPASFPPNGSASGDLSGTYPSPAVAKINGATVPAAGALTTGNVLQVSGVGACSYGPVNLAGGVDFVTGALPTANQVVQAMGGDCSGTTASCTVAKVNGTTYPAGGSLVTGQVPRVTGAATVAYGALDLANTSAVTGLLALANLIGGSAVGQVLRNTGGNVPAWGALDLADTDAVTGVLPVANVDPFVAGQPVNGPTGTLLTFNTSNGTADVTAFTVPASPTGSGRFVLTRVVLRIETAITGGGNVVLRAGSTTGGAEFVVDSTAYTSGTGTAGVTYGRAAASQGTAMIANDFYEAELAAGATVKARATTAGGGISGGTARVYVYGYFLP